MNNQLLFYEFIDSNGKRQWSAGSIYEDGELVVAIHEWRPRPWVDGDLGLVEEEIKFLTNQMNSCQDRNSFQLLSNFESITRRLAFLEEAKARFASEGPLIGKLFLRSDQTRKICGSTILKTMSNERNVSFIIVDPDEEKQLNHGSSRFHGWSPQHPKPQDFFDSRWLWDSSWPTIVTQHSAYFSWPGFDGVLRQKPEETRITFVAEAAFCCQVPMHCIIDTHFSTSNCELCVTFKVVHHPSVAPSDLDLRISQHPFWSLTWLRGADVADKKGLDLAADGVKRLLGLNKNAGCGPHFVHFVNDLPFMGFKSERNGYESELMEYLSLCDKLTTDYFSLQASFSRCQNELFAVSKSLKNEQERTFTLIANEKQLKEEEKRLSCQVGTIEEELKDVRDKSTQLANRVTYLVEELHSKTNEYNQVIDDITSLSGVRSRDNYKDILDSFEAMKSELRLLKETKQELNGQFAQSSRVNDASQSIIDELRRELELKGSEIQQLTLEVELTSAYHEEDVTSLEAEVESKKRDISDLLAKTEEMSQMLLEARQAEDHALALQMQADAEIFRLQKLLDEASVPSS